MPQELKIVLYTDPRLKKVSTPITTFDATLHDLAMEMFKVMRQEKGVGLAAPQIGHNIRLFVMNATGEPQDDRVYVNPVLTEAAGEEEAEEGCLSIPELRIDVFRSRSLRMQAMDLEGNPIDQTADGYVARIWQHETDHLNGILLTDRMGPVAKIRNRALLKELEEKFRKAK
jgi:peptide deformylase